MNIFSYCLCVMEHNKMNQRERKNIKNIKLPQIQNHKTSSSFTTEALEGANSRVRPNSSNKFRDLSKNLFTQLDQYDDIGRKNTRKVKTKKENDGDQQIKTDWKVDLEVPYLKKLEKLIPDTYQKLMHSVNKSEAPSSELHRKTRNHASVQKTETSNQNNKHSQSRISINSHSKSKNKKQQICLSPSKKQQRESSFMVAERQVQALYQQYLEQQGLTELNEITSSDLQQLNKQIELTSSDIEDVRKNMYDIIKKFGNQMCHDDR